MKKITLSCVYVPEYERTIPASEFYLPWFIIIESENKLSNVSQF